MELIAELGEEGAPVLVFPRIKNKYIHEPIPS